jgi:peptidoglycan/LPS O-acetylase OafA/YrhL
MSSPTPNNRRSPWAHARSLAEKTPESRNRYVDLLRAVSICCVILGHWLIAAPWVDGGQLRLDHMLALQPWTQWLTWLLQVMPVFFVVGGYSNAASWEAARRSRQPYREWIAARLLRLLGPVMPLLVVWTVTAALASSWGVSAEVIRIGSQTALIPVWFLAVYVLVVLLAPLTHLAWRRFGIASFWMLTAVAVAMDAARFGGGLVWLAWSNYLFVWLAVHQLGYLWRDGRLGGAARSLPMAAAGGALLLAMIFLGPYPRSMVGVPGEEVSNSLPPSVALLALGVLQTGLLLSLEGAARRWLRRITPWSATVLINGTIMSVYLWHLTTMAWIIGLANLAGGFGLHLPPGSAAWWATRPLWLALLLAALLAVLLLFGRFERLAGPRPGSALPVWRTCGGALLACTGLALLALDGIGGDGFLGIRWGVILLTFAGGALLGMYPRRSVPA